DLALVDLRAPEAARLRQAGHGPRAARARRRGRRRPRGRRVVPAADARDSGRGAGGSPARRDPALPHLLRGGSLGAAGAAVRIDRILVGTDRSETATRAVRFAVDMAKRYGPQVIGLQ